MSATRILTEEITGISKQSFFCAVDYKQRRSLLHRTKLLAAARLQLEAALASGTESARGASPERVYESPPAEAYGGELELPLHGTITGRK